MRLELQRKDGKKFVLLLDGEKYARCYPGDLTNLGFSAFTEGQTFDLSPEALQGFERTVFYPRAQKRALFLLGKKEYTKRELEKKLFSDGYPVSVVNEVLTWLLTLHYVDDVSFAERYAFYLLSRHSEREIVQKMQLKGFDKDLIKEALEAAKERYREEQSIGTDGTESPEREAIRTFLRKKGFSPETTDAEKKKKLVAALYRKGFSLSDIKSVIGDLEGVDE